MQADSECSSLTTLSQERPLDTAMKVIYQWNYDSSTEVLRQLYVKATSGQWIADRDLDWNQPVDMERWAAPLGAAMPVQRTSYWRSLKPEIIYEARRAMAGFRLSQVLHGEQGALMVAGQLVNAIPDTDGKLFAATQTVDEARHVEVFSRYVSKVGNVHPIMPALRDILDSSLQTSNWLKKLVGMQIIVEGLALYTFKDMRDLSEEPLLNQLLLYVSRDESRHHAYGVPYLSRIAPQLNHAERDELEDFAFDAARSYVARSQRNMFFIMLQLWAKCGVDPVQLFGSLQRERDEIGASTARGRNLGPLRDFIFPTLRRCGLLSERLAGRLRDFMREFLGAEGGSESAEDVLRFFPDIPEHTAAWLANEVKWHP